MKQVFARNGQFIVDTVPTPAARPGTVLIKADHSSVSVGTETTSVSETNDALWIRALKDPSKVLKAARMIADKGFEYTRNVAVGNLQEGIVTGYSISGTIIEVGDGVSEFVIGDRVACAGAQCAHHAEFVCVPVNLVAPVPDSVTFADASTVALGAIALQGIRRAQPTLGETFVVLGLGLLGQLTVQMLRANGCRVIGCDPNIDRVKIGMSNGMNHSITGRDTKLDVDVLSDGIGADGVIITAAVSNSDLIAQAFQLCRRKGRVVIVGDIGMNIDRSDIYAKELDVLISTSYGPGRYDKSYEEEGNEYPVSYVRWTENRNMRAYLGMLAAKQIQFKNITRQIFELDDVQQIFPLLKASKSPPLSILIHYQPNENIIERVIENPEALPVGDGKIGIGLVGAGAFVQGTHIPNILNMAEHFKIQAIMTRTGHTAKAAAKLVGAKYATTDFQNLLDDDSISFIIIGTRHDSHAELALNALQAGKNVLVEKPLAITQAEIDKIEDFFKSSDCAKPVLITGFNRRFSPGIKHVHEITSKRRNPLIINYVMNAGFIPNDHWVHGSGGGGRNIGEACHIYDLFLHLVGSTIKDVKATSIGAGSGQYQSSDNFVATISFDDGSLANLTYTAMGASIYPKEKMEVFFDGKVIFFDDYKKLKVSSAEKVNIDIPSGKGHFELLETTAEALKLGSEWPIPLNHQLEATRLSLKIEELLRKGQA